MITIQYHSKSGCIIQDQMAVTPIKREQDYAVSIGVHPYVCLDTWASSSVHNVQKTALSWWRHQMETFFALLSIYAGNSPITGEFPAQRPVTRSFDVFFDMRLDERLSKQSRGWWFETPSCSSWRKSNVWSLFKCRHISKTLGGHHELYCRMMENVFVDITIKRILEWDTVYSSIWFAIYCVCCDYASTVFVNSFQACDF